MLGVELVCAFLPQTELFVPFAAFFVAICLVLCIFDAARKAALCILLGAAVGMASVLHTASRMERIRVQYAARPLVLTAEVESVSDSYYPGVVDAVLRVEKVNGAKTSFRVECETLPECEAGQRVQGRFVLSVPAQQSRVGLYSDGIVLLAEPDEEKPDFKQLGQSNSFCARTPPAAATAQRSPAPPHGWQDRRRAGGYDGGRPDASFPGAAQRLPGRGPCPCAGGERNACIHPVR